MQDFEGRFEQDLVVPELSFQPSDFCTVRMGSLRDSRTLEQFCGSEGAFEEEVVLWPSGVTFTLTFKMLL